MKTALWQYILYALHTSMAQSNWAGVLTTLGCMIALFMCSQAISGLGCTPVYTSPLYSLVREQPGTAALLVDPCITYPKKPLLQVVYKILIIFERF